MDRNSLVHTLLALNVRIDHHQSTQNKIVAYCPFARTKHKNGVDHRPSFAAFVNNEGLSGYLCMACRSKGTINSLAYKLSDLYGVDISGLIDEIQLSEEYGLTHFPSYEDNLCDATDAAKPTPLNEDLYYGIYSDAYSVDSAASYLAGRGISRSTSESLGLLFDESENRVLFPVRGAHGELYGYSGRSIIPDVPIKIKDYYGLPKRAVILGRDRWVKGKPVILVEGLFGFASLIERGVESIANVGAIMGSVLTPEKAEIVIDFDEPVYLMLDNDEGGELGTFGTGENEDYGAAGMLIKHTQLFVPAWPEGKYDPDELLFEDIENIIGNTDVFVFSE